MLCSRLGIVLLAIVMHICLVTAQDLPEYVSHQCNGTTTYTDQDEFFLNLNDTLSILYGKASSGSGFHKESRGIRYNDTVYGLFLCRGDISPDSCQNCIKKTIKTSEQLCSGKKEAVIWYDLCMLRYSNVSIFYKLEETPKISTISSQADVTDSGRFAETLSDLAIDLIDQAVISSDYLVTNESTVSDNDRKYGLVQCTPDINSSDCKTCLIGCANEIPKCCDGKQGGKVYSSSCNIRYETYPFYNSTHSSSPPPAPETELDASQKITIEQSLQFDLSTIKAATKSFSPDNEMGEGGFGSVYKGTLPNGQEIAVKRLFRTSIQGIGEFKNEVELVAKLQHRNLVRLLGFCLGGNEKLLIYEFVPRQSLDYFLFDPAKRTQLDWPRSYKIIKGITRGLLYLHQDSRLKIIHRDLKCSNILLDEDMNPKIADFGTARNFRNDQYGGSTSKVVGTYGYMSPEYAMLGQYSEKSDIFSFGILTLEIISGKRCSSFNQTSVDDDLVSYAWRHWDNGTPHEILDPTLNNKFESDQVMRCITISLLSVQENLADRPTMKKVVFMLGLPINLVPKPKQKPFSRARSTNQSMSMNTEELPFDDCTSKLWSGITASTSGSCGVKK